MRHSGNVPVVPSRTATVERYSMSSGDNPQEPPADLDASSNPRPAEILIKMHPDEILYSQDTIAPVFRRGPEKKSQSKGDAQAR